MRLSRTLAQVKKKTTQKLSVAHVLIKHNESNKVHKLWHFPSFKKAFTLQNEWWPTCCGSLKEKKNINLEFIEEIG